MVPNTIEALLDSVRPNEHPLIRQWRLEVLDDSRRFINGVLAFEASRELSPETVFSTIWSAIPHSWKALCAWTVAGLRLNAEEGIVRDWYADHTCPFPMDTEK